MIVNADKIHFKTTVLVCKVKLQTRNYFVTIDREIKRGRQLRLSTGSVINILRCGKIELKGTADICLQEMFGFLRD